MADHKKLKEQMEKTNDPKEALSIIILHLEKKNRKLQDELKKEKDTTELAKYMLDLYKRDLNNLTLKKNAYKRDYQRAQIRLDTAMAMLAFKKEFYYDRECLYTLWLEQKAHERNLELARDRERLADGWLLEAACIEDFLRKGGVKKRSL